MNVGPLTLVELMMLKLTAVPPAGVTVHTVAVAVVAVPLNHCAAVTIAGASA